MRVGVLMVLRWGLLGLVLSACGTDTQQLLRKDAELTWKAIALDSAMEEAEIDPDAGFLAAEQEKLTACQEIYELVQQRMLYAAQHGDAPFLTQMARDLGRVIALLLPIGQIEVCADAFARYKAAVDRMEQRLPDLL